LPQKTGAARAEEDTGAAAAGLSVGIAQEAASKIAERYVKCPYCLSVIRRQATVFKHCLRSLI
jgi:hypothetical protein